MSINMNRLIRLYVKNWSVENIKKNIKKNNPSVMFGLWQILYVILSFPFAISEGNYADLITPVVYFLIFIPISFEIFSLNLNTIRLDKIYYLCPMDRVTRLEFIKKSYIFRVAIHMTLYTIFEIISVLILGFNPLVFVYIFVNNLILSMIVLDNKYKGSTFYVVFSIAFALLTNMCQMGILESGKEHFISECVLYVLLIIFQIPIAIKLNRNIRRQMVAAVDYEE